MKNILVTGGLGFIGKVLVTKLLQDPEVTFIDIVDNLSNCNIGPPEQEILSHPKVKFYKAKVSDWQAEELYDQIYHLASPVGPAGVLHYAGHMGEMIVSDAIKMANLALYSKGKLVSISTSEVYGKEPGDIPQVEDLDKIVPAKITVRLEYGVAKLLTEISLMNLHRDKGLQVNLARPFNCVGPEQQSKVGFVIPRFFEAALKGQPLTIFGSGKQKRTFTSANDLTDGILAIMNTPISGQIYNLGNPANIITIEDVAKKVVTLTNSKSELHYIDPKTIYGPFYEEAWNKIPNITKAETELNWHPKDSIDNILNDIYKTYLQDPSTNHHPA